MTYSGNKLFNANNLVFIFLAALFGYVTFGSHKKSDTYIGLMMIFLSFLFTAIEAFYFEITTDELIVKNYMLPFINVRYQLSEITSVELNSTNRRSTADASLKVIRDDKSSMGFKGGALNLSDWQGLVDDLNDRKIPVSVTASRLIDKIGIRED